MLAAIEAQKKGFHNVLWLDAIERKYVEEAGLMNVAFVIDGTVVTPPLSGTILPGITRDSVLTLLRDMQVPVEERRISIDEVFDAHAKGTLQGAAGIGTAAVIAPLGRLRHKDREITVPTMGPDAPLSRAGAELEAIRLGKVADRHNWLKAI
jgi:branched-chain amino acid aminotransferase